MPTITIDNVLSLTSVSGNGVNSVTITTSDGGGVGVRIECGSTSSYVDVAGNTWTADAYFSGGSVVDRGAIAIDNTSDDKIYQTERWGLTGYAIPISNGNYSVRLHFAETSPSVSGPGGRLFSVGIGGTTVLTNYDVYVDAGNAKNRAVVKTFPATVSNGSLNITFTPNVNAPMINGIEVLQA